MTTGTVRDDPGSIADDGHRDVSVPLMEGEEHGDDHAPEEACKPAVAGDTEASHALSDPTECQPPSLYLERTEF